MLVILNLALAGVNIYNADVQYKYGNYKTAMLAAASVGFCLSTALAIAVHH